MTIASSLLALAVFIVFGSSESSTQLATASTSVLTVTTALDVPTRSATNQCNEVCQEMRDSNNNFITHFCFPVPSPYGEGEDCLASIEECTLRSSTSCQGGEGGEGGEELLLVSQDGRLLAEVSLCVVDNHVIGVRTLDFEHERQQRALEHAETLDQD